MPPWFWLLPLVTLLGPSVGQDASCLPYLQFNTPLKTHTMCAYQQGQCVPGKTILRQGGLNCTTKAYILYKHNQYRARVARGEQPGVPPAADMRKLVWDDELATVAQRWAEQCTFAHDKERRIDGVRCVGQNVAVHWVMTPSFDPKYCEPAFATAIDAWYNEVVEFGFSNASISPFVYSSPAGHYTQMIWSAVRRVGCGFSCYSDPINNAFGRLYVCNYAQCGNIIGSSLYQVGPSTCAAEDGLKPATVYKGLCDPILSTNLTDPDIPGCFGQPLVTRPPPTTAPLTSAPPPSSGTTRLPGTSTATNITCMVSGGVVTCTNHTCVTVGLLTTCTTVTKVVQPGEVTPTIERVTTPINLGEAPFFDEDYYESMQPFDVLLADGTFEDENEEMY